MVSGGLSKSETKMDGLSGDNRCCVFASRAYQVPSVGMSSVAPERPLSTTRSSDQSIGSTFTPIAMGRSDPCPKLLSPPSWRGQEVLSAEGPTQLTAASDVVIFVGRPEAVPCPYCGALPANYVQSEANRKAFAQRRRNRRTGPFLLLLLALLWFGVFFIMNHPL